MEDESRNSQTPNELRHAQRAGEAALPGRRAEGDVLLEALAALVVSVQRHDGVAIAVTESIDEIRSAHLGSRRRKR